MFAEISRARRMAPSIPSSAGVRITSVPIISRICLRSGGAEAGSTMIVFKPSFFPAKASPIPVFPLLASTIVPPDIKSPRSSARAIMLSAGRSFTEPLGWADSSLTKTDAPAEMFFNFRRGVNSLSNTFCCKSSSILKSIL
jgi:hypothetical protein